MPPSDAEWLLRLLVCPSCREPLHVAAPGLEPLRCTGCARTYDWMGTIPVLVTDLSPEAQYMARVWDLASEGWDLFQDKPRRVVEAAEQPLLSAARGVVLELGCGDGRLFPTYRALGLQACGLDISVGMLQRAQGRGFPVVLADAHRIPLAAGSVDTVLIPLATVRFFDYARVLEEVWRVLAPGGTFGLTAWNAWYNLRAMRRRCPSSVTGMDVWWPGQLLKPLRAKGFLLSYVGGVFSAPRVCPGRERFALRVRGRWAAALARDMVVVARKP